MGPTEAAGEAPAKIMGAGLVTSGQRRIQYCYGDQKDRDIQGTRLLTKKCRPVTEFNPRLHQLLDDHEADTLAEAQGAGLAAPQVGILRRAVLVLDEDDKAMELVNPEILLQRGGADRAGGLPQRPREVRYGHPAQPCAGPGPGQLRKLVRGGGRRSLAARCFCHELEHLDGHLYTEHIDRFLTDEELEAYYAEAGI